jgi:hypothetical protein
MLYFMNNNRLARYKEVQLAAAHFRHNGELSISVICPPSGHDRVSFGG